MKIAYLEISPRLTGKTTRLCVLAQGVLAQGKTVIFVCVQSAVPYVTSLLPGAVILADGCPVPDDVSLTDAVWFYDEFDWLKTTVVREGAYYASTAARLRALDVDTPESDLLLRLIQTYGNRHERHLWPFDVADSVRQHRPTMSPACFRMSMLGEYLA
jgi:hypothetical protein